MTTTRNFAALLALFSLALLPACSMFGGDHSQTSSTSYTLPQIFGDVAANGPAGAAEASAARHIQRTDRRRMGSWLPNTACAPTSSSTISARLASLDADTLASLNLGTSQNYGRQQPAAEHPDATKRQRIALYALDTAHGNIKCAV